MHTIRDDKKSMVTISELKTTEYGGTEMKRCANDIIIVDLNNSFELRSLSRII
jgi:hypothetical protein